MMQKQEMMGCREDHEVSYSGSEHITLADVKQHIAGPVISLLFHICLFAFLAQMIVTPAKEEQPDITADMRKPDVIKPDLEPLELPPLDEEQPDVEQPQLDDSVTAIPRDDVSIASPTTEVVADIEIVDIQDVVVKDNNAILEVLLPKEYAARSTPGGIKEAIIRNKGCLRTERVVRKSLDWLVLNQNDDGSWGKTKANQPVFIALATLAFLGHGETPMSQKYGNTVLKAMKKLVDYGEAFIRRKQRYISGPSYTHPIIVYALAETYSLTKMPKLKPILEHAVKPLVNHINRDGYYYYGYDDRIREKYKTPIYRDALTGRYPVNKPPKVEFVLSDFTFSAWNYQALKAMYVTNIEPDAVYETIKKAIKGLKKANIGYKNSDYTLTCLGAFCLGILGEGKSKEARRCSKFIKSFNPKMIKTCHWKGDKELKKKYPQSFNWAIYTWYYQTMVLFQQTKGGRNSMWARWSKAFGTAFSREQERDGSFLSPAQKYGHSLKKGTAAEWDKVAQFKEPLDLSIYCTVFSCLTLEVYYRYLPTYKTLMKPTLTKKNLDDPEFDSLLEI